MKNLKRTIPLFALGLILPGLSFASYPTMPNWFWQQGAQGLLWANVLVDKTLPDRRVICWQSELGSVAGIQILRSLTVGDVRPEDFRPASSGFCKQLAGIPVGP